MELKEQLIAKVAQYQPSVDKMAALKDTSIMFLVGISGAGKNAITQRLLAKYPASYLRFVTHTTRKPRENHGVMEQDGVDYHFIDFETSERMIDARDYIETNVYSGNVYGTSIDEIKKAHDEHKTLISDVDVNGVANFLRHFPDSKPIFILPPNYETWQQRFMTRYKEGVDPSEWRTRMVTAQREIQHALSAGYYYFVVNDDLEKVTEYINAIAEGQISERRSTEAIAAANDILMKLQHTLEQ